MVGFAVLDSVAPTIRAIGPSLASTAAGSSPLRSLTPSASPAACRKAVTDGVSRTGHSCRPIRATASASSVTALSGWSIEPWPAVPRADSRIQAMPFSAVCSR